MSPAQAMHAPFELFQRRARAQPLILGLTQNSHVAGPQHQISCALPMLPEIVDQLIQVSNLSLRKKPWLGELASPGSAQNRLFSAVRKGAQAWSTRHASPDYDLCFVCKPCLQAYVSRRPSQLQGSGYRPFHKCRWRTWKRTCEAGR